MKKIVAMAMTLCLMLGVAVAENENTFTGTAKGFGGDVSVTITVEDGKITDALVTGDNETPSIGGQAVETLGGAIVEAQSAEFDSVSGATVTSSAVREALKDAMRQAGLMEAASQTMTAGTYEFTYRGYCSNVTVATTVSETAIEPWASVLMQLNAFRQRLLKIRLPVWMAFPARRQPAMRFFLPCAMR